MYQEISQFFNYTIFFYAISIMLFYLVLAVISLFAMREYIRKTKHVYFDDILRSPIAPKISIIAPAYNEELSIVANIRSLLNLHYNNYDIIIVNDGSKDDSLKKMIAEYDLQAIDGLHCVDLPHKEVQNVYRSLNPAFKKLTVIDKKNGGKSDALNAGISNSDAELVACIDVDCVIEEDALLKLVKPYLEETKNRVIAVGGVVRIANDCKIEDGRLIKVKLAKNQLARFQTLEYIRAFLLGRMAWGHLNGLLIISGAFGMFDRKLLIEVGGYDTSTVGEDMELVVRMRRRMAEQKIPYKVAYVPDPLCWTEVPESTNSFFKQRNRWTRGTIETLRSHKKIFLRKKYGLMGMLSYPFWFLYEWLAPIIEFLGALYFLVMALLGWINWPHFYILLTLVYSYAVLISFLALWIEEISYREYSSGRALLTLMFTALIEPIFYHPLTVWAAIKGNFDQFILKKKSWGDQQRKGFKKA
ncbi:glycosyltransferase [Marivirga salinae]|uniref:Glycosyltransferase n=1 Tax=Marivirga salinarum TaxID=3059078 RepID=A0AA51N9D3_9BACT|nr:glycosyltransferase [Marivirga sp. BDSF4-3]WMN10993.1 glycosyltransferase [Marivirga sp. BDSF4-3]